MIEYFKKLSKYKERTALIDGENNVSYDEIIKSSKNLNEKICENSVSLLIADNNVNLISIDPSQKDPKKWNSIGLNLIDNIGFKNRHYFIPDKSYIGLSKLLITYDESYFDFIYIDGWYIFEYNIIALFYAV